MKGSNCQLLGLPGSEACAGCGACAAVCTRQAIAMRADDEGFCQPKVDAARCVGCGRCATVCPVSHPLPDREPKSVWAAQAGDREVREASSSGGVFTLLAQQVLNDGGVVYGAALASDWSVHHIEVANAEALSALRGSKYVQSELGDSYVKVRERLRSGKRVMFVGTPCQTAGLSAFLKASLGGEFTECRERLLLVSIICHAAPSPLAWRKYLEEVARKGEIENIAFRDKSLGWKRYQLKVSFAGGTSSAATSAENPFLRAFLNELGNRRSCAQCASRGLRTDDDLMLGDYWNVASRFPDFDDDRGTSLVLVNSERGEKAWKEITGALRVRASDWEHAKSVNPALVKSTPYGNKRAKFFKRLRRGSFAETVEKLLQPPWIERMKVKIVRLVKSIRRFEFDIL